MLKNSLIQRVLLISSVWIGARAWCLEAYFSENYFNPERVGDSQWRKLEVTKKPGPSLDLGRVNILGVGYRELKILVKNETKTELVYGISTSNLPGVRLSQVSQTDGRRLRLKQNESFVWKLVFEQGAWNVNPLPGPKQLKVTFLCTDSFQPCGEFNVNFRVED